MLILKAKGPCIVPFNLIKIVTGVPNYRGLVDITLEGLKQQESLSNLITIMNMYLINAVQYSAFHRRQLTYLLLFYTINDLNCIESLNVNSIPSIFGSNIVFKRVY